MTDFGWLIEAPGRAYLAVCHGGGYHFYWTADAVSALRFMSQAQANATMMAVRELFPALFAFEVLLGNAKAVEHGFMESTPAKEG